METGESIARHYTVPTDLDRLIEERLAVAGFNNANPASLDVLAALDQFHVGGIGATADLSESYCRVASFLARHTGLQDRVDYRQADALQLPFAPEAFDAVWTQHVSMNVSEKQKFYVGISRVLKPAGRFALHDVVGSGAEAIHFPVPWARDATSSYLVPGDDLRRAVLDAGFSLIAWKDVSATAQDWLATVLAKTRTSGPPSLGLHLVLGPMFPEMIANFHRNVEEHRCRLVQGVFERLA